MNATEAAKEIRESVINGIRGVGCATITMADGRQYVLDSPYAEDGDTLVRYSDSGDVIEYVEPANLLGECEVGWGVDELGGIVC